MRSKHCVGYRIWVIDLAQWKASILRASGPSPACSVRIRFRTARVSPIPQREPEFPELFAAPKENPDAEKKQNCLEGPSHGSEETLSEPYYFRRDLSCNHASPQTSFLCHIIDGPCDYVGHLVARP